MVTTRNNSQTGPEEPGLSHDGEVPYMEQEQESVEPCEEKTQASVHAEVDKFFGSSTDEDDMEEKPEKRSESQMETGQTARVQMIQPIKAPTLKSFSRLDLAEFQMAHSRYLISCRNHGVEGRSVLECLDPKLLVVLSVQYLQKPAKDVTDED